MRKVYTEEEYNRIDSATPIHTWKEFPPIDHCMNYNEPNTYGKIDNIEEVAEMRGIKLFHRVKIPFVHFETIKECFEKLYDENTDHGDRKVYLSMLEEAFNMEELDK